MKLFSSVLLATVLFIAPAAAQDMRSVTVANGTFDIPVAPLRIVSLNDQIVTLPLYELGAHVVGSAGRTAEDGSHFLRGGMDTLGIDYANTDIAYVGGFNELDVEAIAALEPDLIIGGTYTDAKVVERLQSIAPTLVIDNGSLGFVETLRTLANVTGQSGRFEARYQRYLDNVERARSFIGNPEGISVAATFMFPAGEELWVYRSNLGAFTRVIDDLGFAKPKAIADLDLAETQVSFSPELIQELDADFVFGFYRQQPDATPATIRAAYEKFAPGWCQALSACRNNQFVLLPGPSFGSSMTSLELALELVESHIAARGFTPLAN
jgi:iron complex transport system substrate-binding protein